MYVLEQDSRRKFLRRRRQGSSGSRGGAAAWGQAEARGAAAAGPPLRLVATEPAEQEQGRIERFGVLLLLLFAVPFTFHCIDTAM